MKVTYNRKDKKFVIVWRDPLKIANGDKYPYSRKQKSWTGAFPPNKQQEQRIKKELLEFALEEIRKAEQEVEKLVDASEVKKIITTSDLGDKQIPLSSFRPLIRKAFIHALERVNWEQFINWNELYKEVEEFILERVEIKNDPEDTEI